MRDILISSSLSENWSTIFKKETRRTPYPLDFSEPPKQSDLISTLLSQLVGKGLGGQHALDLGCGEGRLVWVLAPYVEKIWGLDWNEQAIQRAKVRASQEKRTNVSFAVANVEAIEYDDPRWGKQPDIITANLCMSDTMIERAGRALGKGSIFAGVSLHPNQWRETGFPSRFAYSEKTIVDRLVKAGFRVDFGRVEEEVLVFESSSEAKKILLNRSPSPFGWTLNEKRRDGLQEYLDNGGRELTHKCQLLVIASKMS